MFLVPRLRCYGCVRTPFYTNWLLDAVSARDLVARVPADSYTDFEWVAVERHFDGAADRGHRTTKAGRGSSSIRSIPSLGAGSRRARCAAACRDLLAHWDNKASNQRLVCLDAGAADPGPCREAVRVDSRSRRDVRPEQGGSLEHWKATPIWTDRARCIVSMRQFPYSGGTFSRHGDLGGGAPAHRTSADGAQRRADRRAVRGCALPGVRRRPGRRPACVDRRFPR